MPARLIQLITILVFASITNSAYAESIEIKGIAIGMTEKEILEKHPSWDGFTIGGIPSKYQFSPLTLKYHEERLDSLAFFFDSNRFESILLAVKGKYPSMVCTSSSVSNAMGAEFEQIDCVMSGSDSTLGLSRYINLHTSALTLNSKRSIEEMSRMSGENKDDI